MRLHRFFTTQTINPGQEATLFDSEITHQIRRVFRLQVGHTIVLFDGSGIDYEVDIVSFGKDSFTFHARAERTIKPCSDRKITLAVSLIKKDNFEWIVQKATELGVSEFIPLVSDRSEKKGFNKDRAQKIMIEACEQSGRGDIPHIQEPILFEDFLVHEKRDVIAFHTDGTVFSKDVIKGRKDIVACIGPEGGWSDAEMMLFKKHGATVARLNTPILRAETAAVTAAVVLLVD